MILDPVMTINTRALARKVRTWARKVGRVAARPVILMWYVMRSKDTPKSDKLIVLSALTYIIFPIDIISARRLPIIGFIDELAALAVAYEKLSHHITPEMERQADELLDRWFQPEVLEAELPLLP